MFDFLLTFKKCLQRCDCIICAKQFISNLSQHSIRTDWQDSASVHRTERMRNNCWLQTLPSECCYGKIFPFLSPPSRVWIFTPIFFARTDNCATTAEAVCISKNNKFHCLAADGVCARAILSSIKRRESKVTFFSTSRNQRWMSRRQR